MIKSSALELFCSQSDCTLTCAPASMPFSFVCSSADIRLLLVSLSTFPARAVSAAVEIGLSASLVLSTLSIPRTDFVTFAANAYTDKSGLLRINASPLTAFQSDFTFGAELMISPFEMVIPAPAVNEYCMSKLVSNSLIEVFISSIFWLKFVRTCSILSLFSSVWCEVQHSALRIFCNVSITS